jgi:Protein of unknown function (DUF2855)
MTAPAAYLDFLVKRDDLHIWMFAPAAVPETIALQRGQVLMKIDKFAFTSNNITYAVFGDAMCYWNFFAAPEGWGRIPAWGFADVIQSLHDEVQIGERFYGYYPMSSHVVVQPERVGYGGFFDGTPHRQALHALYNRYLRTTTDPGYAVDREAELALLRPLFMTSFMIDDFLADNGFFGAGTLILSSASSKTAYGLAFLLSVRGRAQVEVVGLTAPANLAFTESLSCYHRVLTYDQIATLPQKLAVVYVDMAGNGPLRSALHRHFGANMKYSCAVGATHWDRRAGGSRVPGPRPIRFFAPAQIEKRSADWGPNGVQDRFAIAWRTFLEPLAEWMKVRYGRGPQDVERVYLDLLRGKGKPEEGHILTLS